MRWAPGSPLRSKRARTTAMCPPTYLEPATGPRLPSSFSISLICSLLPASAQTNQFDESLIQTASASETFPASADLDSTQEWHERQTKERLHGDEHENPSISQIRPG